jgi:hypothetical protein
MPPIRTPEALIGRLIGMAICAIGGLVIVFVPNFSVGQRIYGLILFLLFGIPLLIMLFRHKRD